MVRVSSRLGRRALDAGRVGIPTAALLGVAVVVSVAADQVGSIFQEVMPEAGGGRRVAQVSVIAAALVLAVISAAQLQRFVPVRTLRPRPAAPAEVLLLPLSPLSQTWRLETALADGGPSLGQAFVGLGGTRCDLSGQLRTDIVRLTGEGGPNWLQVLRPLEPHRSGSTLVVLIGSADDERGPGSFEHVELAASLVRRYGFDVRHHDQPVDFHDVGRLYELFCDLAGRFAAERDLDDAEVVIDVTAGFKPTSIAGAQATLHKRSSFQYVPNTGEVRQYDSTLRSRPEPHV